ncbi:thioredoxin domain-containing protein [Celeribacter sp.]|uniref:thioredoxin domain-containing protein n=1 Tax=Celeribacter sp. TaxID=1890673 RepID=UPI003A8EFB37
MKRRDFILTAAASTGAFALSPVGATAAPMAFTPGLVAKELAAGKTVFLDFKASWCTTCAAQERVINALKAANPAYEQHITFIDVDWDDYGRHAFTKGLNIPRRSTLVVLKGDQELGRIVAQTGESEIKALMDTALDAAGM